LVVVYIATLTRCVQGGFLGDLGKLVSTEHAHLNQILWDAGCGELKYLVQDSELMHDSLLLQDKPSAEHNAH